MQNVKVTLKKMADMIAGRAKGPCASTPDPFMRRGESIPGRDVYAPSPGIPGEQSEPSRKSANAVPNQPPQALYC